MPAEIVHPRRCSVSPCNCDQCQLCLDEMAPTSLKDLVCKVNDFQADFIRAQHLYKNYEHPTENDISNWELILKSAFNIVKRSGVNRIEFLRFVIDRTSLINTNANIGNVVILVVHNKLNMMYNEDDETAYLMLPTYSNPKRLCNLRIDHLPLCVMFNSLRAEKFHEFCQSLNIRRPWISVLVANRE